MVFYPQLIGKYHNEIIYNKVYKPLCIYPESNRYYGIYDLDDYSLEIFMSKEEASINFTNIIERIYDTYQITYLNYY